jgi:uncharacterized protein
MFEIMSRFSAFLLVACLLCTWPMPGQNVKPEELIARSKVFVDLMAKEDFAGANKMLDASIQKLLSAEQLSKVWKMLPAQFGAYQKQVGARHEPSGLNELVIVNCEFQRSPMDFRFTFNGSGGMVSVRVVPGVVVVPKPDNVKETELVVDAGDWPLPATLSTPASGGPFPAVVLVHGSGPQDQDETIFANKPFRDLAWGLASRGIAVLRYFKRTKEYPNRATAGGAITLKEETVDDAVAAVALLRKTADIDAKRIFVLGHSLGGMAIPRIGAADPAIRGFIMLAGSTRPMEDMILSQMTYILSNEPTIPQTKKDETLNAMKAKVALVKDAKLSASTSARDLPLAIPAEYWLDLRGYNPAEAAKLLKQPMLVLQGERDYQVTMDDFNGWKTALGDRKNVVFKTYPALNHLFIAGEGKSLPAEYMRPGRVAANAIDDIAAWVKAQ